MFAAAEERRAHCIQDHKFPHNFRFGVSRKQEAKNRKLKHNKNNKQSPMEVDSCAGDKKCEMRVKVSQSRSEAAVRRRSEQSDCANVAQCAEGAVSGQATSANQPAEDMHTETFSKPFSFVRGRGRNQRLGAVHKDLRSGINKRERTSGSNVWGTSSLLNALQDAEIGSTSDVQGDVNTSDVQGDVRHEQGQISLMMDT
jgi:hypothetical protein